MPRASTPRSRTSRRSTGRRCGTLAEFDRPLARSVQCTRFDPPNSPQWIGFDNYLRLLTDDRDLRVSLMNSLYMVVFGLPIQLVVALALAVLLNQRLPGERIFRAALYMPVVLALNAAVLLCWRLMLNANNGLRIQRHGLW